MPALLGVLVVTSIAVFSMFASKDIHEYLESMLAALLFYSNLYFCATLHVGNFFKDVTLIPLIHTWSLGVEEQFYIFWPLLLLIMKKRFSIRIIFVVSFLICLCSFLFYYFFNWNNLAIAYYSTLTRMFQILIGALLAIAWRDQVTFLPKMLNHIVSLIGLALIIYAGCFVPIIAYPGAYALLPCAGSALLIYTGKEGGIANRVLATKPLVFTGLISYSLYLWHWPIISFMFYNRTPLTTWLAVALFVLIFIISALSWKYVEQPFRFKVKFSFIKTFSCFVLVPVVIAACLLFI